MGNCGDRTHCHLAMVILREIEHLSNREIADCIGAPIQTVCNMFSRKRPDLVVTRSLKGRVDWSEVIKSVQSGASYYEIERMYGISHETVSKKMTKCGISRGRGSNSRPGGLVSGKKMHERLVRRFDAVSDKVVLIESRDSDHNRVRCVKCGHTFNWNRKTWGLDVPCAECRKRQRLEDARMERERQKAAHARVIEASKEWRLSVPRICKHCGIPFYSEYESVAYCSESCKRRAKLSRRKARGFKPKRISHGHKYKKRMRVVASCANYDRTVTLDSVYKKYRGVCCACGKKTIRTKYYSPRRATLDHVVALANNGTHTWDNVQLLCAECNSRKRDLGQMRLAI